MAHSNSVGEFVGGSQQHTVVTFTKMHGCGNDFVLLDGVSQILPPTVTDPRFIRHIAHRRTGIGFDQLMVCTRRSPSSVAMDLSSQAKTALSTHSLQAQASEPEFTMDVFNADGTRAGMCGNGARCFAAFAKARGLTVSPRFSAVVPASVRGSDAAEPSAPPRIVEFDTTHIDDDASAFVSVCLGRATVIPVTAVIPDEALSSLCCRPERIICVDVGNPHCVLVLPSARAVRDMNVAVVGESIGAPGVQGAWAGPGGCNVGFVAVDDEADDLSSVRALTLTLRVWERGCGETPSCGSGSCAAALAVIDALGRGHLGRSSEMEVDVRMPGGTLVVTPLPLERVADAVPFSCQMNLGGPTATVFHGTINIPCLFEDGDE